jgi:molybdenum cofactor cytidylyltransferase
MKLQRAFEVVKGEVVAFTGAGGKTSALVGLGYELHEAGWRVLATTTTRIGQDQLQLFPRALPYTAGTAAISAALNEQGYVFLYSEMRHGKVYGVPLETIPHWLDNVDSDVLLIEADGARGLPWKAPYAHEPVIPPETTLVVPVTSLAALGQPLDEMHVYNPQAMIDKFGFYAGGKIRLPWLAQVLRDEEMGLKGVPAAARVVAFINQTPDKGYLKTRARQIAKLALRSPRLNGVALGSVRAADPVSEVQRPIGAIVLAAGQSSRMGQPKVLLPWDGKTILEHIIAQLSLAKIDEIVVVTGFYADEVRKLMHPTGTRTIHNRAHKTGEMLSSLQTGLKALPHHIAATLIVLGDQPHLQPKVIGRVLKAYAEGAGHIVAPSYQMRRGHPILIDRRYWAELLALEKGGAPRDVINAHQDEIAYVTVDTDSVLQDVDTPADYREALRRAGLKDYNPLPRRPGGEA